MTENDRPSAPEVKRLYRSRCDVKLAGVAGGIGEYFGVDPIGIRILLIFLGFISFGTLLLIYLIAAIIIPQSPGEGHCVHRFYRSSRDRMLAGICGGLAETWQVDPTLLRLGVVAAVFFTGGIAAFLYLAAWILMPLEYKALPPASSDHE